MKPLSNEEAQRLHDELVPSNEWRPPKEIIQQQELRAVNWVLTDNIPEGIGMLAGSSGVGKTVAVVPLACLVAGFTHTDCNIKTKVPRKVIFFTEDDAQLNRSLFGVRQLLKADGQGVDFERFTKMIHVFPAQRLAGQENEQRIRWAIEQFSIPHEKLGKVPPLIVLDTDSANFDLEDENSNAQVGRILASLKEVFLETKAPIWVIAHLIKSAKGLTIDDLLNASARGGGAWEADCYWTAAIGRESDTSSKTILKIDKERAGGLRGHEIHFKVNLLELELTDDLGDLVMQKYPQVTITQGNKKSREHDKLERHLQNTINAMSHELLIKDYLSAAEIKKLTGAKTKDQGQIFAELLIQQRIKEIKTPHEKHKDRKVCYVLPTQEDLMRKTFLGIVGKCDQKSTPENVIFESGG